MKKIKIAPMSRSLQGTGTNEENLEMIKNNFKSILNLKSVSEFDKNYKAVFTLIHNNAGDELYNLISSLIEDFVTNIKLSQEVTDQFPEFLYNTWEDFKASMKSICGASSYMDNTYFKQKLKPSLNHLGLTLFKDKVMIQGQVGGHIKEWIIEESMKNKNGEVYEKNFIKSILNMLIELGFGTFSAYEEIYETNYFEASKKFYKNEAENKFSQLTLPEYISLVQRRIYEEEQFCINVISVHSQNEIVRIVIKCFIEDHIEEIFSNDALLKLLKFDDFDTLKKIYEIFCEKGKMIDKLKHEVKASLKLLVEEIYNNSELIKKPISFMEELFKCLNLFTLLKDYSFKRNRSLECYLNLAFEASICQSCLVPTYLAIYLDHFFKKYQSVNLQSEFESKLSKILSIFPFIRDKDIFELKNRQFLASRLLDKKSNIEEEETVIKYLKQECGLKFVSKVQGMINDIKNDSKLESDEFYLRVLSSNNWPAEQFLHISVPESLSSLLTSFNIQYAASHTGRRLTYRFDYSSCEILFNLNRKRTLVGSLYQGCILLMFNDRNSISLNELLAEIRGTENEIKRHLLGLVKAKVLIKTSKGKVLLNDDVISFNEKFTSSLVRINLEVVGEKMEARGQDEVVDKSLVDERKHFLEAAIVKVMKMRRSIEHKELIGEVVKLTAGRFEPDIKMIKSRIETLIQREYIERSTEKSDFYNYIS